MLEVEGHTYFMDVLQYLFLVRPCVHMIADVFMYKLSFRLTLRYFDSVIIMAMRTVNVHVTMYLTNESTGEVCLLYVRSYSELL